MLTKCFCECTGEVLELGAYWSVKVKNVQTFERYLTQLQTFYFDSTKSLLPASQRMFPLLGLNLVRLLAQNRIADFHTLLERIDADTVSSNIYLKFAVKLEQCLMEGSYNKVLRARSDVPAEEYIFFMDMLAQTIRNEVALCVEKAYESIPILNAGTMMFIKEQAELMKFCQSRHWVVNAAEKRIYFEKNQHGPNDKIPAQEMATQLLGYAGELERIV